MNKKLFVSDIDGTLLKSNKDPHERALKAIQHFCDAGGLFSLCTGRALPAVRRLLPLLPSCVPYVLCGGALIYDFQNDCPLECYYLDDEIISSLRIIIAEVPSISVTVSTATEIFRIHDNQRLLMSGVYEDRTAPTASLYELDPLVKVLLTCDDFELLKQTVASYIDLHKFNLHRASTHFYELTDKDVNKGTAILQLKNILGCSRVFCAGDALSDLPMASVSELFFAPETAMDQVKRQADFIFPNPENGGIAWALDFATECEKEEEQRA